MNGVVTAGAPTCAPAQKGSVRNIPDKNLPAHGMHLGVALEAKVVVALEKHLVRNRTVGLMADDAPFPQRLVLIDHRARLFTMTLRAGFVKARQNRLRPRAKGGAMGCFENIRSVRVVALHAVHSLLEDRVVVRQPELRVDFEMTTQTGLRRAAGVDDEPSAPAAGLRVQTAGPMTRFATGRLRTGRAIDVNSRVGAGGKYASELGMAIDAAFIAQESCAFDRCRNDDGSLKV